MEGEEDLAREEVRLHSLSLAGHTLIFIRIGRGGFQQSYGPPAAVLGRQSSYTHNYSWL